MQQNVNNLANSVIGRMPAVHGVFDICPFLGGTRSVAPKQSRHLKTSGLPRPCGARNDGRGMVAGLVLSMDGINAARGHHNRRSFAQAKRREKRIGGLSSMRGRARSGQGREAWHNDVRCSIFVVKGSLYSSLVQVQVFFRREIQKFLRDRRQTVFF
jgi:hypothetical protein